MRHTHDHPKSGPARATLYQEITDRVLHQLEQGSVPWVQPWDGARSPLGLPVNALSGRRYSGINILILWDAVTTRTFGSQRWLTFKQALSVGGHVRKGEHGTTVCYADRFIPKEERTRASEEGDEPNSIPFLKRFTVFNVEQCEDLPKSILPQSPPLAEREIVPAAEALICATGADFRIGGGEAFYHWGEDFIRVPDQAAFFDQINFYRTCCHELGHWTGHASRLARDLAHRFGSEGYAREELVAEIASAFLCASLAIQPTVRHADYIAEWLKILRNDNRAIFQAASMASKASDFILGFVEAQGEASDASEAA